MTCYDCSSLFCVLAATHSYCRQSTFGHGNLRQGTAELFLGPVKRESDLNMPRSLLTGH